VISYFTLVSLRKFPVSRSARYTYISSIPALKICPRRRPPWAPHIQYRPWGSQARAYHRNFQTLLIPRLLMKPSGVTITHCRFGSMAHHDGQSRDERVVSDLVPLPLLIAKSLFFLYLHLRAGAPAHEAMRPREVGHR
jgi:hypothetical protein